MASGYELQGLNMSPDFTDLNEGHGTLGHAVYATDVCLGASRGSNFNDLLVGELGASVGNTLPGLGLAASTPLRNHVRNIVCIGAKKKMIWTNACSVVAFVKYVKSVRNFANVDFPGDPVRPVRLSPEAERTVSLSVRPGYPAPATVRLFVLFFESIFRVFSHGKSISHLAVNINGGG